MAEAASKAMLGSSFAIEFGGAREYFWKLPKRGSKRF